MALSAVDAFTYGILPALVGTVIALILLGRAGSTTHAAASSVTGSGADAVTGTSARVFWLLPLSPLLFAGVGSYLAYSSGTDVVPPILMLGVTCGFGAAVLGHMGGKQVTVLREHPLWLGKGLVLTTVLETSVIFVLVAFVLAISPDSEGGGVRDAMPYFVLGASAVLTMLIQTFLATHERILATAKDETLYGKLLIRVVAPETIVILGLVWFMLQY